MAKIIGLPKLSPTMDEGVLARWAKKVGDEVAVDDILAEVETDKATMEFRSFDRGVVLALLAAEGESLKPDAPVLVIGQRGEDASALVAKAKGGTATASEPVANTAVAPAPAASAGVANIPVVSAPAVSAGVVNPILAGGGSENASDSGRVMASPLVRKLAREHALDLRAVPGSGPHGRIVKRDVDAFVAAGGASSTGAGGPPSGGFGATLQAAGGARPAPRIEKLSPMRKTIARRLTESKQTVPHFYLTVDLDVEPLLTARAQLVAALEKQKEKVSVNDLLIKACATALRLVPECNASFMGDAIHYHQRVDISVAVAVPEGLVTPVVRDADRKGVLEIAREVRELAARARDRKLRPEEMADGTFSLSNLGMFDIESFGAVINPPEGAILAVGAVREEPVVRGGQIVPGKRMRVTLSCDHRVIDGAVGARWLQALRGVVEQPVTMLL